MEDTCVGKVSTSQAPKFGTETDGTSHSGLDPPSIPAAGQPMETPEPSHPQKFLVAGGGDRETGTRACRSLPHMTHSGSGMAAGMRRAGSLAVRDGSEVPSVRHQATLPLSSSPHLSRICTCEVEHRSSIGTPAVFPPAAVPLSLLAGRQGGECVCPAGCCVFSAVHECLIR